MLPPRLPFAYSNSAKKQAHSAFSFDYAVKWG
jgi:hypothetical protein